MVHEGQMKITQASREFWVMDSSEMILPNVFAVKITQAIHRNDTQMIPQDIQMIMMMMMMMMIRLDLYGYLV